MFETFFMCYKSRGFLINDFRAQMMLFFIDLIRYYFFFQNVISFVLQVSSLKLTDRFVDFFKRHHGFFKIKMISSSRVHTVSGEDEKTNEKIQQTENSQLYARSRVVFFS